MRKSEIAKQLYKQYQLPEIKCDVLLLEHETINLLIRFWFLSRCSHRNATEVEFVPSNLALETDNNKI